MKRQTARVLRGVLRLIENDLREIADSVVEIDEREAAHYRSTALGLNIQQAQIAEIEATLADHADNHSRRIETATEQAARLRDWKSKSS